MSHPVIPVHDPKFDLMIDRVIDLPPERIWAAWTQPELLKQWFCPAPWTTVECEIDLYPGGLFRSVLQSPEGQAFPHMGCFLEVIENEKLVWTTALGPGYRPLAGDTEVPQFTAAITLGEQGAGTRYTAIALHKSEADCSAHNKMGFHEGWGAALDQMVALLKAPKPML